MDLTEGAPGPPTQAYGMAVRGREWWPPCHLRARSSLSSQRDDAGPVTDQPSAANGRRCVGFGERTGKWSGKKAEAGERTRKYTVGAVAAESIACASFDTG